MEKQKKLVGLCYYANDRRELEMAREAGFNALRLQVPFPWQDKMYGALSDAYKASRELFKNAKALGFSIMLNTPGLGSYRFDHEKKITKWVDEWPDWLGMKDTRLYFENVCKTCAWLAEDLCDVSGPLWCHGNEIDIETFHGDYAPVIAAETCYESAAGVKSVLPDAMCGINLSHYWDEGVRLADMAYHSGHCFDYIGDDQYFGSWQGDDVEKWNTVIETLHDHFQLPVVANEWGYSSGGALKPRPETDDGIAPGLNSVCHVFGWHHEIKGGHTPEVQAEYIHRGLELFANNPNILGSFLFCWKDAKYCYHCGKELCPSECFWGIVDQDGKPKPALYAVQDAVEKFYKDNE
ncbi:hypothetical protein FACS1894172_05660 [Spirochaetia bacterium]|nr:hypothetical protein FACS1894164_00560 [Spirochaetia bacterium]GHU31186.1 hypothetical protein FACS1894172_05660 [Spirochaetia bacterium]